MKEARSKLYLWEMEQVKVTCSDGYSFLVKLFFFFYLNAVGMLLEKLLLSHFVSRSFAYKSKNAFHCLWKAQDTLSSRALPKADWLSYLKLNVLRSGHWNCKLFFVKFTHFSKKAQDSDPQLFLDPMFALDSLESLNC